MAGVEKARIQLISLESATVDSALGRIMKGIRSLDLEVTKGPKWKRIDPKEDNIAPYDFYATNAQKKKLIKLRAELSESLAKEGATPYVPAPINVKRVRMKTMEVQGGPDLIWRIHNISLAKEMEMPGGILLRVFPTK
ncbi:MAG: hypothetical protein KGH58_00620 [Candidatus Micrarchaeota archaeon]|nr:hypothetical protein [Candidatus Micrarchaeota archaeon]